MLGLYKTQYGIDALNELSPDDGKGADSDEQAEYSAPSAGGIDLGKRVNSREGQKAPGGHLR